MFVTKSLMSSDDPSLLCSAMYWHIALNIKLFSLSNLSTSSIRKKMGSSTKLLPHLVLPHTSYSIIWFVAIWTFTHKRPIHSSTFRTYPSSRIAIMRFLWNLWSIYSTRINHYKAVQLV